MVTLRLGVPIGEKISFLIRNSEPINKKVPYFNLLNEGSKSY